MRTYCKKCILCGAVALTISDIDIENKTSGFYAYKRVKYCTACADQVYIEQHRERQKRYKQNKRAVTKLKDQRLMQLTEYSELLREQNRDLQTEIDCLKALLMEG